MTDLFGDMLPRTWCQQNRPVERVGQETQFDQRTGSIEPQHRQAGPLLDAPVTQAQRADDGRFSFAVRGND